MRRKLIIGLAAVGLVALSLLIYGLFLLPHWAVLIWAILATALLPALALGGWAFGRYEATATLKGIDTGIDRVAGAAAKLHTARGPINVAVLPQSASPQLPMTQITQRQLPSSETGVIEL